MTGSDLIVMAPWIIFAVCLALLCARLIRARRSGERPPSARRDDEPEERNATTRR